MAWQCAVACVLGCLAWIAYGPTGNHYERLLAGLLAGFGGQWAVMFCWVWLRYGWSAARSLTMD